MEHFTLYLYTDGELWRHYPIAVGKGRSPSPVGEWKIVEKPIPLAPELGTRWLGLNVPWGNYGIHGTDRPWSIGWASSGGCFRMYNEDIEEVYPLIPLGTPVIVKGPLTPIKGPLKPGKNSPEVVTLQLLLRSKGFYVFGPADGYYGTMTQLAVKLFQLYTGLEPSGTADAATLNQLNTPPPSGITVFQP
mgnify:CR=1 FL=1